MNTEYTKHKNQSGIETIFSVLFDKIMEIHCGGHNFWGLNPHIDYIYDEILSFISLSKSGFLGIFGRIFPLETINLEPIYRVLKKNGEKLQIYGAHEHLYEALSILRIWGLIQIRNRPFENKIEFFYIIHKLTHIIQVQRAISNYA